MNSNNIIVSLLALNMSFDLAYCLTNCLLSELSLLTHLTPLNEQSDLQPVLDELDEDELDELGHELELVVLLV